MAVQAGDLARIQEVINAINARIRNPIQNRVVWHRGNLPANCPGAWAGRFGSYSGLSGVSISGGVNTLAIFNNVYNGIINAFDQWSHVRRCTFVYRSNYWTNSWTPGWTESSQTQIAYLSDASAGIVNGIKNRRNYLNTLLKAADFNAFLDELYRIWDSLKDTYGAGGSGWVYSQPCHSSCHSDCHKSGGRR